ncbi:hypothetical protein P3G55_14465 [Leptospira sp. 96542]|nr:hypothetical protein [Leptospira sp. 96542]
MATQSTEFIANYLKLLEENYGNYSYRCYEFISGGDSLYTSKFPIKEKDWKEFSHQKQAEVAENYLNVPSLNIGYPGTESGPYTKDLQIFYGLDKLESLSGDFMMVESYHHLLKLKNLDRLNVDTYAHLVGYIKRIWTVFDALIFSHEYQRRHLVEVEGILKYKKELQLDKPFDFYSEDPKLKAPSEDEDLTDWNGWDEWEENLKKTITKEFLYKNFSL